MRLRILGQSSLLQRALLFVQKVHQAASTLDPLERSDGASRSIKVRHGKCAKVVVVVRTTLPTLAARRLLVLRLVNGAAMAAVEQVGTRAALSIPALAAVSVVKIAGKVPRRTDEMDADHSLADTVAENQSEDPRMLLNGAIAAVVGTVACR